MKTLRLLIVITFLLVGCATKPPVPTATEAPEATATVEILPTATEPAPLPTETTAPTEIQLPTATPATNPKVSLIAPCLNSNQDAHYSPQIYWIVATCTSETDDGLTTKFANIKGTRKWSISFVDQYINEYKINDVNRSELLKRYFIPIYWTMNEDYVYLAVESVNDTAPYWSYDGLLRLDLDTGKITSVLRPATAPAKASYSFQFSPDGNRLAYINYASQSVKIMIDEMATGNQQIISLDARFVKGGNMVWSSDGKKLIVSAIDGDANGGAGLIMYDLETNTNRYIMQQSKIAYLPVTWVDENTIYALNPNSDSWVYIDLTTAAVSYAPAPKVVVP